MITAVLHRPALAPTEGASSRIGAILDHLRRRDPELTVVSAWPAASDETPPGRARSMMRAAPLAAESVARGTRIVLLSGPALPLFESPSRSHALAASAYLRLVKRAATREGALIVLNLHDLRSLQLPDFDVGTDAAALSIFRRMERRSLKTCDYVLAPGGRWPEYLEEHYGVPAEKLIDFPNGCIRVAEGGVRRELPGKLRFVYAGTMTPLSRGVETAIEQFTRIDDPEATLLLLGPGGATMRDLIERDSRVHDFGPLPVDECIRVLRRCHVALYPYPDRFYFAMTHTTSKMALYLTCGLPVLANRSAAVEQFVTSRRIGEVVPIDRFSTSMERIVHDPTILRTWRQNVSRIAHDFHWDEIIDDAFAEISRRSGLDLSWIDR